MDIERIRDKLSEIKVYLIELDEDIPEDKEEYLEDMVSFRNLLVHRYGNVDDSRAYSYLKDEMNDLYQFILMIEKLIES